MHEARPECTQAIPEWLFPDESSDNHRNKMHVGHNKHARPHILPANYNITCVVKQQHFAIPE